MPDDVVLSDLDPDEFADHPAATAIADAWEAGVQAATAPPTPAPISTLKESR